jgi:hypothetical protein
MKQLLSFNYLGKLQKLKKEKPFLTFFLILSLSLHITLFSFSKFTPKPKLDPNRRKLIVKTISAPEHYFVTNSNKQVEKIQKPQPKANQKSQLISSEKKEKVVKKISSTGSKKSVQDKKEVSTKSEASKEKAKAVLYELQENLAKIQNTKEIKNSHSEIIIPESIPELKADSYQIISERKDELTEDFFYQDLLLSHLKDHLVLPAYGSVKIELTLSSNGKLESMNIIASDSEINRFYLEKNLNELSFPIFSKELSGKKNHTFYLTFCSD